jgi:hypothetical protein
LKEIERYWGYLFGHEPQKVIAKISRNPWNYNVQKSKFIYFGFFPCEGLLETTCKSNWVHMAQISFLNLQVRVS